MSDIAYIIPIKINDEDNIGNTYRINNLEQILLHCIKQSIKFNIYITETNVEKSSIIINLINNYKSKLNLNYNLIINKTQEFDRAHTFNCTIKHFIDNEEILIMGDCDIPLYKNIFQSIKKIRDKKYYFISPYNFIEKLSMNQTNFIYKNNICLNEIASNFQKKPDKNPYSFSGGILVVNRLLFEKMGLWFEINGYGGEDRILDVILEHTFKEKTLRETSNYIHLWHPESPSIKNIAQRLNFVNRFFGCKWTPNSKSMHQFCSHKSRDVWGILYKTQKKGDLNKYNKN